MDSVPSHFYITVTQRHISKQQLIMAVSPNMGWLDRAHWMDSEDTGQWLCNACSQFNWCLLLLSNKVLKPDWMACNFPSKLCFGWRVVRQSRQSSVDSRWIWLLVKPLLYKDKMASAPIEAPLRRIVWRWWGRLLIYWWRLSFTSTFYAPDHQP